MKENIVYLITPEYVPTFFESLCGIQHRLETRELVNLDVALAFQRNYKSLRIEDYKVRNSAK